jgi:Fur family peroxide stress response transcriptional regulator
MDTVYRTLWLLTDLGLISTLGFRRDAVQFDANLQPHHHYVCVKCGQISDVQFLELERLQLQEHLHRLGTVESAHLEIRGVCADCVLDQPSVNA